MPPRKFRRRNNKKTKRTKRPRVPRNLGRGYVTIVRKAYSQLLTASGSGTATVKDPTGSTGTILTIGTPVLSFNSSFPNVYDIPFSMAWHINDISSYADLTQLCDRFKLLRVKVIVHGNNVNQVNGALSYAPMPWLEYAIDNDDADVPSITSFDEKMGNRIKGFNQMGMLSFSLSPKPTLYGTGGENIVVNKAQWIDCAGGTTVAHFGVKGVIRNVSLYDAKSCGFKWDSFLTVAGRDFQ